jgi:hypothetical protein
MVCLVHHDCSMCCDFRSVWRHVPLVNVLAYRGKCFFAYKYSGCCGIGDCS